MSEQSRQELGTRTRLDTPILLGDRLLGAFTIRRRDVRPFSDEQIAQLETYAALAAAIERAQLAEQLRESLQHQTATAEVLSIISRSPTDVQPVFDAICESAARVCGVSDVLFRVVEGGDAIMRAWPSNPAPLGSAAPLDDSLARHMAEHGTLHVPDILAQDEFPALRDLPRERGTRTWVGVLLRQQNRLMGWLSARRPEVQPLTPAQIKLMETFADQAVFAIENVRLFDELQQKTREQAETLEEQAATNHILEIISQSPTDVQPVLDAIVESAARVCEVDEVYLRLVKGENPMTRAHIGPLDEAGNVVPLDRPAIQWIAEHGTLHFPDLQAQDQFPDTRDDRPDTRTFLVAPLRRQNELVGIFGLRRPEVRPFTERQIKLIETFADQALIAIENVRLFHELGGAQRPLREALEHQTATAEVLSILSRSPTDVQSVGPVPQLAQDLFALGKEAFERACEVMQPGVTWGEVEERTRAVAKGTRCGIEFLLHGRGLGNDRPMLIPTDTHEHVREDPLRANTVFILKPYAYVAAETNYDARHARRGAVG